jgi:hypothetical protein
MLYTHAKKISRAYGSDHPRCALQDGLKSILTK